MGLVFSLGISKGFSTILWGISIQGVKLCFLFNFQRQLKGTNLKSPGFFSKKSIQLGPQPPSSQPSNIQQIVLYFSQLQAKKFSTNSFILYIWPGWCTYHLGTCFARSDIYRQVSLPPLTVMHNIICWQLASQLYSQHLNIFFDARWQHQQ